MARPQKQNADWFSHDNCMRNDKKIKAVRAKFGVSGYGVYCMLLESLTEADLIQIEWNELEIEMLSGDFGIESESLKEIVDYFIKINLFQRKNGYLFCRQLESRLKFVFDKRKTVLGDLRKKNLITDSETMVSAPESTQRKGKGSKGKKSISLKGASQDLFKNASDPLIDEYIESISSDLYDSKTFPRVHAFVNAMRKEQKNPRAILHTLNRVKDKKPDEPWSYSIRIIDVENGNYNEADHGRYNQA